MAVGVQYGVNEKKLTQFARLSYQAWYPIIDFTYQAGARQTQLFLDRKQPLDSLRTDQWQQSTYDIGFRIPFNLTHGAYQERLQIGSNLGLSHVQGYDLPRRLYTQPFNRFELPFLGTSGIIDNDKVNLPGTMPFFVAQGFTGILPAGTPYAQLLPFKRENWESEIELNTDQEILYKKNTENKEKYRVPDGGVYQKEVWERRTYN
jgi:hypothetical protein